MNSKTYLLKESFISFRTKREALIIAVVLAVPLVIAIIVVVIVVS